jgi:hypothetical protein
MRLKWIMTNHTTTWTGISSSAVATHRQGDHRVAAAGGSGLVSVVTNRSSAERGRGLNRARPPVAFRCARR